MQKRSNTTFVYLWIACAGLAFVAGGMGRISQGKSFIATFDGFWQNIFYAVGGVIGCVLIGWLCAKLLQRLLF